MTRRPRPDSESRIFRWKNDGGEREAEKDGERDVDDGHRYTRGKKSDPTLRDFRMRNRSTRRSPGERWLDERY